MSIVARTIIAPHNQERSAIVRIPLPAGGEMPIDVTWEFLGWAEDMKIKRRKKALQPMRITVELDDDLPNEDATA